MNDSATCSLQRLTLAALVLSLLICPACAATAEAGKGQTEVDASLHLRTQADHASRPEGEGFVVRVTFHNVGTEDLCFHVPEHRGIVPFPSCRSVL